MPKVSQDYKEARRDQILCAAKRCFARQGFHETSMQDLFAEAGLSAGAVYSYFPSKTDVIEAIAEANMNEVLALVHDLTSNSQRGLAAALETLLTILRQRHADENFGPVTVLAWSEALRNPALASHLRGFLDRLRDDLADLIRAEQAVGTVGAAVDAEALARLLAALVPGFILEATILGAEAMDGAPAAIRALLH